MGHDVAFSDEVLGEKAVQRERNGSLSTQVGCVSVAAAPRSESQVSYERKRKLAAVTVGRLHSDNRLRSEGRGDRTGAIERILYNVHRGRLGADSTACLIEHTAAHRSAPLTAYIEVRRNVPCDASI